MGDVLVDQPEVAAVLNVHKDIVASLLPGDPSIFVGRRGSGKTTMIHAKVHERSRPIELSTSNAFAIIKNVLASWRAARRKYYVANIAELWSAIIWNAVLADFAVNHKDDHGFPEKITEYAQGLCGDELDPQTSTLRFTAELMEKVGQGNQPLSFDPTLFLAGDVSLARAIEEATYWIQINGVRPTIIFDTMDDQERLIRRNPEALQGLLLLLGQNTGSDRIRSFRFSIPAELYPAIGRISRAPLRDLYPAQFITWQADELVKLLARRLAVFTYLYEPQLSEVLGIGKMPSYEDFGEDEQVTLLRALVPANVMNGVGREEDCLTYIIRHTQLLPRHVVVLMNHIWAAHVRTEGATRKISAEAVQQGIDRAQYNLILEIFRAHAFLYPDLEKTCQRIFPHLYLQSDWRDLRTQYNSAATRDGQAPFAEAVRMLLAAGAIGVKNGDEDEYVLADFGFQRIEGIPPFTKDATFCLHPLFTRHFGCKERGGVFPHGKRVVNFLPRPLEAGE